jgi:hypothetical protein
MWIDGSMRVVLAGAEGAGQSKLLDAIAGAAKVHVSSDGSARWLETTTPRRRYQIVEAPTDAVDALIPSAHLVVIVVAATDGPMPTTKRHVEALQRAGLGRCVLYLDDAPIAESDSEITELVEMEMRELFERLHLHVLVLRGRGDRRNHVMGGVGALASALDAA